jgi:hypothetical protein
MSALPGMPEFKGIGDRIRKLEAEVARLSRARKLESASVGAGGIKFKDGGKATFLDSSGNVLLTIDEDGLVSFEADGSQLSVLDGSRLRFNRSDGTRIAELTPAGGLRIYAANGTTLLTTLDGSGVQVGSDVVIDSAGLKIKGVLQAPGVWTDTGADITSPAVTLNTSFATLATLEVDPPAWVNTLSVMLLYNVRAVDQTGESQRNVEARISRDSGAAILGTWEATMLGGQSFTYRWPGNSARSTVGGTFDFQARVTSGGGHLAQISAQYIAFGIQ